MCVPVCPGRPGESRLRTERERRRCALHARIGNVNVEECAFLKWGKTLIGKGAEKEKIPAARCFCETLWCCAGPEQGVGGLCIHQVRSGFRNELCLQTSLLSLCRWNSGNVMLPLISPAILYRSPFHYYLPLLQPNKELWQENNGISIYFMKDLRK